MRASSKVRTGCTVVLHRQKHHLLTFLWCIMLYPWLLNPAWLCPAVCWAVISNTSAANNPGSFVNNPIRVAPLDMWWPHFWFPWSIFFIRSLRSFCMKEDLDSQVIGYCSSRFFSTFIYFQKPYRDGNNFLFLFVYFAFQYLHNGKILNWIDGTVRICWFSFLQNAQAADKFVCAWLLISKTACCLEQKPAHLQLCSE